MVVLLKFGLFFNVLIDFLICFCRFLTIFAEILLNFGFFLIFLRKTRKEMEQKAVLILGAGGQLGQAFQNDILNANHNNEFEHFFYNHNQCDITDIESIRKVFSSVCKPIYAIINCAAYTNVDKAELEPEVAESINVDGIRNIVTAANEYKEKTGYEPFIVHFSTDYVFDGTSSVPYTEDMETNPISVYGRTKRDGENILKEGYDNFLIIRTSWVFSKYGKNFVKTICRLLREKDEINVVCDQHGCPTTAEALAYKVMRIVWNRKKYPTLGKEDKILNLCGDKPTNWFDFAKEIKEWMKMYHGDAKLAHINPIISVNYPAEAKRPMYSVLDTTKAKSLGLFDNVWIESFNSLVSLVAKES